MGIPVTDIVDNSQPLPPNVSRKELVKLAKEGNEYARYTLTELNLRGMLEEAKNPNTREEVAIEMLAQLGASGIKSIRIKALRLLLRVQPERLQELVQELESQDSRRNVILNDIIEDDTVPLRVLLTLMRDRKLPEAISNRLEEKFKQIRKIVEEHASQIVDLNTKREELSAEVKEKFQAIEKYFQELQSVRDEIASAPKIVRDLKIDVELAYKSLNETINPFYEKH